MESIFNNLIIDIEDGMNGKNQFIPIGLPKLGRYANIRKNILTLIFSTTGAGKCFAKGTKVLMYNGSFKNIEDITVDDAVMGIDSNPRKVLETHSGYDDLYIVHQNKGEDYIVNGEHILRLVKRRKQQDSYLEIPVKDVLNKTPYFFHEWKGYKSSGINFDEQELPIDPYLLGLWIGDGTACKPQITTADKEIVSYLDMYADQNQMILKKDGYGKYNYSFKADRLVEEIKNTGEIIYHSSIRTAAKEIDDKNAEKYISNVVTRKCKEYNDSKWNWIVRDSSFLTFLQNYNLLCNKYIPDEFIINSRENRLKLLAGIIDSDGHYQKSKNGFEITLKNKEIIDKVAFLSRSLGYYTSINPKMATLKRKGKEDYNCLVYRIFIWGERLGDIPCLLPRKKAVNKINKLINPLSTGISIEPYKKDEYFGFSLDGDGLFMLEDLTVVHNSSMIDTIILNSVTHHMLNPEGIKPDFQLFSMERASKIRIAKWICFLIFVTEGVEIQLPKMMGWWDEKLTKEEYDLINKQKEFIDQILGDYVTIHDGAKTPNEIYKILKDHFENKGEYDYIETIDKKTGKKKETKIYSPKNQNEIVIPIWDHGNLTKTTQALPTKKQTIDTLVQYAQGFRDLEGAAPIWVSQVNRSISGVTRMKDSEQELVLEDVKESGDIGDASDVAFSIFDPVKYSQSSKTGYNPVDFVDRNNGNNYFRSVQILKSSYGADSIRLPMAFNGFCGQFMELPKRSEVHDSTYQNLIIDVLNKSYFLR